MLLTPDLNHPSIIQLSLKYRSGIGCLYRKSLQRKYVDTASFSFGGSELVRGASSSNGCSIYLESLPYQRNLDSLDTDESPTEGFTPYDLSKLCCRCAKLCNIADVVFVRSGLNASCSWKVFEVGSSAPSAKRANDVEGSADNVDDVDNQDDAHYHSADNSFDQRTGKMVDPFVILLPYVLPIDPDRTGSFLIHKTLIFLRMLVLLKKLEEDAPDCTRVDDDVVEFSPEGGDYFPTMGDETKKDKCFIFLLLLIICLVTTMT
ncbi:hypothetical protein Tco_1105460 [Tanacetum coccineum]